MVTLNNRWVGALRLPILALLASAILYAQAGYEAQIRGAVTDPSGGVVPDASVTPTNASTDVAITTETNTQGVKMMRLEDRTRAPDGVRNRPSDPSGRHLKQRGPPPAFLAYW